MNRVVPVDDARVDRARARRHHRRQRAAHRAGVQGRHPRGAHATRRSATSTRSSGWSRRASAREDYLEGQAAFAEKRAPRFTGRLMPTKAERALARVRKICAALPDVEERPSHSAPTFFYKGKKSFLMFHDDHHGDGRLAIWCAAPIGRAGPGRARGADALLRARVRRLPRLDRPAPRRRRRLGRGRRRRARRVLHGRAEDRRVDRPLTRSRGTPAGGRRQGHSRRAAGLDRPGRGCRRRRPRTSRRAG